MMTKIKQALILCGGKGQRLRPITNDIPKPLVEINGESILSYQLKYLQNQGIQHFIIATGYKSKVIESYLLKTFADFDIKIIDSGNVDIMSRIIDCAPYLNDQFLISYGDTLADIDIQELSSFHNMHEGKATISSYQLQSQFGILKTNKDNLVLEFLEKPKLEAWINIGYFIFEKSIINSNKKFADFISSLALSNNLYSYKHHGLHITVNTIKELEEAKINIKNFI